MALTITIDDHSVLGSKRVVYGRIAFDTSYPTGGEALTANNIGLGMIDDICFTSNGRLGYIYYTDTPLPATTLNVEILCPTGGTAPAAVSDPTVNTMASGNVSITASASTIALTLGVGGIGVEMGDTANCSSLTNIRFVAFGSG